MQSEIETLYRLGKRHIRSYVNLVYEFSRNNMFFSTSFYGNPNVPENLRRELDLGQIELH